MRTGSAIFHMLHGFEVVLLDSNGTFMFEQDRFGADQDYARTYRALGGASLSPEIVQAVVNELVDYLTATGHSPLHYDTFPSVASALRRAESTAGLAEQELIRIERVIAAHELGRIPEAFANVIHALAKSHRLGVVSNLWSVKMPWLAELERVRLLDVFDWLVFSSDGESTKPSSRIFEPILSQWHGSPEKILMVGDSLERDVAGAQVAGIKAMWIRGDSEVSPRPWAPEFEVGTLLELV